MSTYIVNPDGTLATITAAVPDGQAALCSLVGTGDTFFGGNAGSYRVRLRIRREAAFPYDLGYSPSVVVRVR